MAYGITHESQLIDIYTIMDGINKYRAAIEHFDLCGKKVVNASEICTPEALSVDENSLQYPIEALGLEIQKLKDELNAIADELLYEAQLIRQEQYNELMDYQKQQALLQQQQQQQQTNP
jgi:hypothetical protein